MSDRYRKQNKLVDWTPPQSGILKFNVDGASKGKPRPTRIAASLEITNVTQF